MLRTTWLLYAIFGKSQALFYFFSKYFFTRTKCLAKDLPFPLSQQIPLHKSHRLKFHDVQRICRRFEAPGGSVSPISLIGAKEQRRSPPPLVWPPRAFQPSSKIRILLSPESGKHVLFRHFPGERFSLEDTVFDVFIHRFFALLF